MPYNIIKTTPVETTFEIDQKVGFFGQPSV